MRTGRIILERIRMVAKEQSACRDVQYVPQTASPALPAIKAKRLTNIIHRCIVIRGVVKREVSNLVVELEFADDLVMG